MTRRKKLTRKPLGWNQCRAGRPGSPGPQRGSTGAKRRRVEERSPAVLASEKGIREIPDHFDRAFRGDKRSITKAKEFLFKDSAAVTVPPIHYLGRPEKMRMKSIAGVKLHWHDDQAGVHVAITV